MILIYHYNKCSKSRQALALLEENGIDFSVRYYVDQPLNKAEISALQQKLQIPIIHMIRTDEVIYKELFEKTPPSENDLIQALAENPVLMQRPIVETANNAVIARPPEKLLEII